MLRESQTRRLKKKASASSSSSSGGPDVLGSTGLPGYKTALASALASFVLVYYFFHVTQYQVNDSTSIFQRCDYTLSKDFDWNATYEAPCWKDLGLRKEEWKDEPEKAVQILKKEGAVFLQGVLNQEDVDIARPHIVRRHMMRSRNRTYLESPYARLKDPKGRYELFGNLEDEVERELLNKLLGSISGILDRIVGSDARLTEFNYITQCKCGMQSRHKDLCSYVAADRNNDDYCTDFYSLFVPMQHTPSKMGGTQIWPGTHFTLNMGEPVQAEFNAGDAMLYNQRLAHRGGINFLYKSRIMTVVVVSSNGKGKFWKLRDSCVLRLLLGSSYFLRQRQRSDPGTALPSLLWLAKILKLESYCVLSFSFSFPRYATMCLAGGPPGFDRNYILGDLKNNQIQTLGAKPEYMHTRYVPEGGERCRAECPIRLEVQASYKGRIIKVFSFMFMNSFLIPSARFTNSKNCLLAQILLCWKDKNRRLSNS